MPQPRSKSSRSRSSGSRKPTAKRTPAPRKTGGAGSRRAPASGPARAGSPDEIVRSNLKAFADALSRGVITPLNLVMVSRERMQEVLDDAVARGRLTGDDANDLVGDLFRRGRKQTDDVLADLEQLLGRGREQIEAATGDTRKRVSDASSQARKAPTADRMLREVDRARRAAGLGAAFPVLGYDDLNAGQVDARIADLTPAQLRKVRDYERRHANRKSVLTAIERALA